MLLVEQDPQDDQRRILASVKCNVAAKPPSLAFHLAGTTVTAAHGGAVIPTSVIKWDGISAETAESLTTARIQRDGGRVQSKGDMAQEWLRVLLGGGPLPKAHVLEVGAAIGLTERTIERAATACGVVGSSDGFGAAKHATWSLRETGSTEAP